MRLKRNLLIILTLGCILYGCGQALYMPDLVHVQKAQVTDPGITLETLQHGRTLYTEKCSSCHTLFLPKAFSKEKWTKEMEEMAVEAKLQGNEKKLILDYLTSSI